jgi:hypothetical protein
MNDKEATSIIETLQKAVISTKSSTVRQAFSALVFLDAHQVTQHATQVLAALQPATLIALCQSGDDLQHRLMMEVFDASLLAVLQAKPADVEPGVADDIETWIEANAAAVASANLKTMEVALPDEDPPQAHRTLIEFHHHIDFAACEKEQNDALQRAWSAIAAQIEEYLANIPEVA